MVTGEPGSGKTSLGLLLSDRLHVPFLSRDGVRGGLLATAGLWNNQMRSPAPREEAVETFVRMVETASQLGISAVLEFVVFRERAAALERLESVANCLVVKTMCADAGARADLRDRSDALLNRRSVLDALGYGSIDDYLLAPQREEVRSGMQTEFELPTLTVVTDDGYAPRLDEIVEWIVAQARRG